MTDIDSRLQQAFDEFAALAPHDPDLAATIRRRSGWRRARVLAPVAAAVAVLAVTATVLVVRSAGNSGAASAPVADGSPSAAVSTGPSASACAPMTSRVLPEWARAGFTDPEPKATYVLSQGGLMAAITFGPLAAPQQPDTANKILWVAAPGDAVSQPDAAGSADAGFAMNISGHLEGGTSTMQATVAVGPSTVDVPEAGCWIFDLQWGTRSDTIAVRYAAGDGP